MLKQKNLASWDRWVRLIVGLFLISLTYFGFHWVWGLLGLILAATSFFGKCPIYALFGWNTCPLEQR